MECNSSYVRKRDLVAHCKQIHGRDMEEQGDLKCSYRDPSTGQVCGKQCFNKERLTRHMKTAHQKKFK
jgi:hypothetical protein